MAQATRFRLSCSHQASHRELNGSSLLMPREYDRSSECIELPLGDEGVEDGRVHGEVVSENRPHLRALATRKLRVESAAS